MPRVVIMKSSLNEHEAMKRLIEKAINKCEEASPARKAELRKAMAALDDAITYIAADLTLSALEVVYVTSYLWDTVLSTAVSKIELATKHYAEVQTENQRSRQDAKEPGESLTYEQEKQVHLFIKSDITGEA